jgi:hypothetical protein
MIYPIVAVGQFGVILLTQMAVLFGWIFASTALGICVALAATIAVHSLILHLRKPRP